MWNWCWVVVEMSHLLCPIEIATLQHVNGTGKCGKILVFKCSNFSGIRKYLVLNYVVHEKEYNCDKLIQVLALSWIGKHKSLL